MRSELIFNGQPFSAFDAYVATSNFLDGAAKDYTSVSVLGRSGDLQISNNRYKNITVKVRVYVRSNMEQNIRAMRSYLESVNGYARLELSDQPNEYRIGLYKEMFVPSSYDVNVGVVDLTFDCKPQRFLKSGEIPVPVSPVTETTSGNPAVIDNMSNLVQVDDLQIAIEPVQDLHGYDSPWVGGAGKNLLKYPYYNSTSTVNGVTFTVNSDGTITATGQATANAILYLESNLPLKAGTYIVSGEVGASSSTYRYRLYNNGGTISYVSADDYTLTLAEDSTINMSLYVHSGYNPSGKTFHPMIRLASETDASYAPYENICPISGHTSATVTSALKNLLQNTSSSSTNHGITFTKQSDSTVVANGTADGDASFIINFTWNLDDGDYQLSGCAEGGSADKYYCFLWDRNANTRAKDWDGNASESSFNPTQIVKVRLEHGVNYGFYLRVKAGVTVSNIIFYPMICAKYHGTVYIKYTAKTVTCDFDRTVYGGYLDVTTGVLTVDTVSKTISSVSGWANRISNQNRVYATAIGVFGSTDVPYTYTSEAEMIADGRNLCDKMLVKNTSNSTTTPTFTVGLSTYIYLNGVTHIDGVTDMESLETWINDNPLQITYRLATPQTYQLTPSILKLSSGVTYNFADTGRIVSIRTISPATLTNPTRFDSKPIIRVWGNGTLNVNSYYITVANSPYDYIDIDCELMDCYHGSNNANQYVTFSTTGFVTLNSGANYFGYSGFSGVHVIPRWYEV